MRELLFDSYPEVKDIMLYSEEKQRLLYYTNGFRPFFKVYCDVDPKKTYFVVDDYRFGYGKKLYYRKISTLGFTFADKKVQIWFKADIKKILSAPHFGEFLSKMNVSWFKDCIMHSSYNSMITKTVFEKVLNKKINNITELITHWCKYSALDKTLDVDLVKGAINSNNFQPQRFKYGSKVFVDRNQYLRHLIYGEHFYEMGSLIDYAYKLNEKIDFTFDKDEVKVKDSEMKQRFIEKCKQHNVKTHII